MACCGCALCFKSRSHVLHVHFTYFQASGTGEAGTANLQDMTKKTQSRLHQHLREALAYDDLDAEPPSKTPKLRVEELRAMAFSSVSLLTDGARQRADGRGDTSPCCCFPAHARTHCLRVCALTGK